MGATKDINMLLNFRSDTPLEVFESIRNDIFSPESFLASGYRHPCGKPVSDFYLDIDRPQDYHKADGTYYLRYCNHLKDYANKFEAWLDSIAPYIIQVNGHHVGTMYHDGTTSTDKDGTVKFICIEDGKVVYKLLHRRPSQQGSECDGQHGV